MAPLTKRKRKRLISRTSGAEELLNIPVGQRSKAPELDTFVAAVAVAVAGENQEMVADEKDAGVTLLARSRLAKSREEFERSQRIEERFHKDCDGIDFTQRESGAFDVLPISRVAITERPGDLMTDPKENSVTNGMRMRGAAVIFLAISSLLLSSCADFKLPPDQPWSNRHGRPGSGDCTFRRGSESELWA